MSNSISLKIRILQSHKKYKIKREERDLELKKTILKAFNHRGYKKGSRSIKMTLENKF